MKKLIILIALSLTACTGTGDYCKRIGLISAVAQPADTVETSANKFDTPATVERVEKHNEVVGRICGALPVREG